uniref:LSDAT_euk domain-containing protein n=1 Tax=Mesocestoides corti TaxID=53468 RepID=A0A5K3EGW4_MESCO
MSFSSRSSWRQKGYPLHRRSSQRQRRINIMSMPLLGEVINEEAEMETFDPSELPYFDFRTNLIDGDVMRLIDTVRRDDHKEFESYAYDKMKSLTMNVVMSQLPSVEYMSKSFWGVLHGVGLLHLACIFSAHSIIDVLLQRQHPVTMTEEGVTAVHICAAMGDYAGLRKVLMAGFPYLMQDKSDKLPEEFCQNYRYNDIRNYLDQLETVLSDSSIAENDDTDPDIFPNQEAISHRLHCTLALHFEAYLCTQVSPTRSYDDRTYCDCCDEVSEHEEFSCNPILNELISSRGKKFIKRPTNAFGQFETSRSSVMAEFVRIADDTQAESLEKLFFEIWNLKEPDLAVTLYGTVPQVKSFQKRFYNLIFGVFQKTMTWIVTDGSSDSVAEILSQGMRGYAEAYGLKTLQVIGLVPWRRISCKADLCSTDYLDSGGLASILEQCIAEKEYLLDNGSPYSNQEFWEVNTEADETTERVVEIMLQHWTESEINQDTIARVMGILYRSQLIEIFSEKDPNETLDGKIVSSLINTALFDNEKKEYSWKPRLKIAMELNRTDFVLEKILADVKWTTEEVTPFVRSCLLTNKVHFLQMFVDAGFDIHGFADAATVEELYTTDAQQNIGSHITIERVKKTLQKIMGHHFLTYNKENPKQPRIKRRNARKNATINMENIEDAGDRIYSHSQAGNFIQYLYLWALITMRYEVAQFILTLLTDMSTGALFAAAFLRRKAQMTKSPSDGLEHNRHALEFERIAVSILESCYFDSKESTMQLLVMERRSFGRLSCLMIASDGNCGDFIQHRACQEYMDRVWAHTLVITKSWGRVNSTPLNSFE